MNKKKVIITGTLILSLFVVTALMIINVSAASNVSVSYDIQNDWGDGAVINVTLQNNSSSEIDGWTIDWTFPGNQKIVQMWGASYTQNGENVSTKNIEWNSKLGANQSVSFGFLISYSGSNDKPTEFKVNSESSTEKTEEPTSTPSETTDSSTTQAATTTTTDDSNYGKVIEVASDGSGQYNTIKSAVESISKSNSVLTKINIKPGTYKEKFTVDRPKITFSGQAGKEKETILTYDDTGTSTGYTMLITADDVSVENMTIENSTTQQIQAPALMTKSNRTQFRNCSILGLQDTLYAHSGTQYYKNCYIEGRVDYIFGGATAVFEDCEMKTVQSGSAICAPSTPVDVKWGIIFLGGKATASSNISSNSQWLARSWSAEGFTAYIGTYLDDHIKDEGWGTMSKNDGKLDQARFYEYNTTGPGANPSARAEEVAPQLSDSEAAMYTVENIFESWIPSYSK